MAETNKDIFEYIDFNHNPYGVEDKFERMVSLSKRMSARNLKVSSTPSLHSESRNMANHIFKSASRNSRIDDTGYLFKTFDKSLNKDIEALQNEVDSSIVASLQGVNNTYDHKFNQNLKVWIKNCKTENL